MDIIIVNYKRWQKIANALQLEAARRHASPFRYAMPKFEVAEPIHCRIAFLLLIRYFTL